VIEPQQTLDDIDPDLAWVEREIIRCENGPILAPHTPENMAARNERLARLKAIRSKLLGEEH